jgi:hypothetical protein
VNDDRVAVDQTVATMMLSCESISKKKNKELLMRGSALLKCASGFLWFMCEWARIDNYLGVLSLVWVMSSV